MMTEGEHNKYWEKDKEIYIANEELLHDMSTS